MSMMKKLLLSVLLLSSLVSGISLYASMDPFVQNLEKATLDNDNFRHVIYTVPGDMQLVLMSLLPYEDIGLEVHPHVTQFIRIEKGIGVANIGEKTFPISDGFAVLIPAGTWHNITNASATEKMKIYTIYTPPQHAPETVSPVKPIDDHN